MKLINNFGRVDYATPVRGPNMKPTLESGDIVLCQRISLADVAFPWHSPCVITTTQGKSFVRLHKNDINTVLAVSDNKDYEPFVIPVSYIQEVALIKGVIRML